MTPGGQVLVLADRLEVRASSLDLVGGAVQVVTSDESSDASRTVVRRREPVGDPLARRADAVALRS